MSLTTEQFTAILQGTKIRSLEVPGSDKRQADRFLYHQVARLTLDNGSVEWMKTRDISMGGVAFWLSRELRAGTALVLDLPVDSDTIVQVNCVVLHS